MTTKKLVLLSLLIALHVILSEFLAIRLPLLKIGFSFVPLSIMAMLMGPIYTCIGIVLSDIIGLLLFPPAAPPFWGFTLSSGLTGFIYGYFLYKKGIEPIDKKKYVLKIIIACAMVSFLVNSTLNTYWLTILYGDSFLAILPVRLAKNIFFFLFHAYAIYWFSPYISYNKIFTNYTNVEE
ncbi:MAG: folate family ECF transporter S component [Lachnospirales bacterium]